MDDRNFYKTLLSLESAKFSFAVLKPPKYLHIYSYQIIQNILNIELEVWNVIAADENTR